MHGLYIALLKTFDLRVFLRTNVACGAIEGNVVLSTVGCVAW